MSVGTLQAAEAMKIVMGVGQTLAGRLVLFDALTSTWRTMRLARDPDCAACAKRG